MVITSLLTTPKEEEPPVERRHPLVIQIQEKCTSATTLDLLYTQERKLPKRKIKSWIQGLVEEYKPLHIEVDEQCVPLEAWADDYNPSCSILHEVGMGYLLDSSGLETSRMVGNGSNRDVWAIREYDGTHLALKTVQLSKKFFDMNLLDRNRRDAVASEQLSASPYIMDIYGFCGNSALYEFGDGGELSDIFKLNPTKDKLLIIAHDVATAVADSHHVNAQGRATIAHADIKPAQFLKVNGRYMLNDFNRARFLYWDPRKDKPCGFRLKGNGHGAWRAPEEYLLESENEKIDVFSLGNVLYFLLTGKEPFEDDKAAPDVIVKRITEGKRVSVNDKEILKSTHPFDTTVLKALDMCLCMMNRSDQVLEK